MFAPGNVKYLLASKPKNQFITQSAVLMRTRAAAAPSAHTFFVPVNLEARFLFFFDAHERNNHLPISITGSRHACENNNSVYGWVRLIIFCSTFCLHLRAAWTIRTMDHNRFHCAPFLLWWRKKLMMCHKITATITLLFNMLCFLLHLKQNTIKMLLVV